MPVSSSSFAPTNAPALLNSPIAAPSSSAAPPGSRERTGMRRDYTSAMPLRAGSICADEARRRLFRAETAPGTREMTNVE